MSETKHSADKPNSNPVIISIKLKNNQYSLEQIYSLLQTTVSTQGDHLTQQPP